LPLKMASLVTHPSLLSCDVNCIRSIVTVETAMTVETVGTVVTVETVVTVDSYMRIE